jgi:hypothetical protein
MRSAALAAGVLERTLAVMAAAARRQPRQLRAGPASIERRSRAALRSESILDGGTIPRMRLRHRLLVTLLVIALIAPLAGQSSDEQAVRATINQYFRGHATASPDEMRKAFLPTAHIEGIRGGKFVSWTVEEYCANFKGKPAADEASRTRTIDSVDISGTAAMVRATLVHGQTTFTDYFVLLKVDGEWKIANKVYSSRPTK